MLVCGVVVNEFLLHSYCGIDDGYDCAMVSLHWETMDFFLLNKNHVIEDFFFLPIFIILSDIEESKIRF